MHLIEIHAFVVQVAKILLYIFVHRHGLCFLLFLILMSQGMC